MKIIIPITIIMILVLVSCNFPSGQSDLSQDVIATNVAGTLAAVEVTTTNTQPSLNGLPTISLDTLTPSPTATETVTPTPTISPDDPKLSLGSPDFWFSSASSGDPFGVVGSPYDDDAVTITNQVGGLHFVSKNVNQGKRWRMTSRQPTDFYLEGTFKVYTCSGKDNYGLAMRKPTYTSDTGYYVGLSCDGNFILDRIDQFGNGESISGWVSSQAINVGENQVNRLGVMLIDDSIKIYINGVFVNEFTDTVVPNKGYIGAYVSARGNTNFTFDLQELMEWDQ